MYTLSPPPLSEFTPNSVLDLVSIAQGYEFEGDATRDEKIFNLSSSSYSTDSLSDLARWVNPKTTWTKTTLLEAFEFIRSDQEVEQIGEPTPSLPRSMGWMKVYRLMREMCEPSTTIEQMFDLYRLSLVSEAKLREMARSKIQTMKKEDLIRVIKTPIVTDPYTFKPIPSSLHGLLTNTRSLQENIVPTKHISAIGLSLILYGIDISSSSNPMEEYEKIREGKIKGIPYISPSAKTLSAVFLPHIPKEYYSDQLIAHHLSTFGIEGSSYELLKDLVEAGTFYSGVYEADPFTTITFEDATFNPSTVTYKSSMTSFVTTIEEMEMMIDKTGTFEGMNLSEPNLTRLTSINPLYKRIVDKLKLGDKVDPSTVPILEDIFKLGMHLRGWESGPYPDLVSMTSPSSFNNISILSTELVHKIKTDRHFDQVSDMACYTYKSEYVRSTETIGKVIDKVANGTGCVRLASNYLCATACRYLTGMGHTIPDFHIEYLRWIS